MFIRLCLLCILFISVSRKSPAKPQKETLPDGKTIAFYEIKAALSPKQLKKIEQDINTRISRLSHLFKNQSPKKNFSSLLRLKKYMDNIYKKKGMKYAISNTPLNSRISLLSNLLNTLPDKKRFHPNNCEEYIRRLRVKAHVSIKGDEPEEWTNRILQLSEHLCPKNKKDHLSALNRIANKKRKL